MEKIIAIIDLLSMSTGTVLGFLFGDITPLMYSLLAMVALDCITGLLVAASKRQVSSEKCFMGLCKKFLLLPILATTHIIDFYVTNTYPVLQSAVCLFFIAHEAISVIENAAALGVPIPKKLMDVLDNIQEESGGEAEEKAEDKDKTEQSEEDTVEINENNEE